jgi:hypothetical protein
LTLTTFKSVGGTTKPVAEKKPAISKPAAAPKAEPKAKAPKPAKAKKPLADTEAAASKAKWSAHVADENAARAGRAAFDAKPAAPKGGRYVVIAGAGTMPIGDFGDRRVKRGESDWVSDAEIAWLNSNGCEFKLA